MLKRNDYLVAKMLEEKDLFIAGATTKNIWEDGKPTENQFMEVVGFVLLEGLDYQEYRFKYPLTAEMEKKILELKNNLTKVCQMPGYNIDEMFCYKDKYFGQNLINIGD